MLARESAYVHVAFCVTEFQLTIDRDAVRQAAASHFNERFQRRAANQSRRPLRLSSSFLPPPPSVYVTSPFLPSSLFLHVRDCVYPCIRCHYTRLEFSRSKDGIERRREGERNSWEERPVRKCSPTFSTVTRNRGASKDPLREEKTRRKKRG